MYYLIIWDKELAAIGRDGSLSKLEIPIDVAESFFRLDSTKFPNLSSLSFDDYDLFSDDQVEMLVRELLGFARTNPLFSEVIEAMLRMISKAQSLAKASCSILSETSSWGSMPFRMELEGGGVKSCLLPPGMLVLQAKSGSSA